jgi:imidazolonepropionase-like amidohydrolase
MKLLGFVLATLPCFGSTYLVRDTSIVDVVTGHIITHRSVLIAGGEIKRVGPEHSFHPPGDATVVNGRGKYLMPGLWDMHVHLWYPVNEFPLYLSWGVTGVRDMGSNLARTKQWQHQVDTGKLLGPHVITPGPPFDGRASDDPKLPVIIVHTPEEARREYDVVEGEHVDFIKVLSSLPPDAYFALLDRARKWGLPVAGHVPEGVTVWQAIEARQRSMEHLIGVLLAGSAEETKIRRLLADAKTRGDGKKRRELYSHAMDTFDWERADKMFAQMKLYDVWQTPTLTMWRRAFAMDPDMTVKSPELMRTPTAIRSHWEKPEEPQAEIRELTNRQYELYNQIVSRMQQDGVPLLAGTDTGDPWSFPGLELHEELELMVKAGLTPVEALRTATVSAARYLDAADSVGRIESGYVADLVLLDANPLADIANARRIAAVFAGCHYLTKAELSAMVAAMNR